MDNTILVQYG